MLRVDKRLFAKELNIAKLAAKKAGKIQSDMFASKNHIIRKSSKELVSRADIESQKIIESVLKKEFPDYKIFTEEKSMKEKYPPGKLFWIIDPLDGTHNFIAGLPFYGVSIALADLNSFHVGIIYLPAFNSLFWAVRHEGAYCNGQPIKTSNNDDLSKSMITYDNQFYLAAQSFTRYQKLIEKTFTTRIIGSAVYDLALILTGKIDARVWNSTKICDVAAGIVLMNEAGGRITDFKGNPLSLSACDVIASNGYVHNDIIAIVGSG